MNIIWEFSESDIKNVVDFVDNHKNPFVNYMLNRNVNRKDVQINRDSILKAMFISLLTSRKNSIPYHRVIKSLSNNPSLLSYTSLAKENKCELLISNLLKENGIVGYTNKIPTNFSHNFSYLLETNWNLKTQLDNFLKTESTKVHERELADSIDIQFKGFGSTQARNFLQALGLTKYEIPLDSRIIKWMNDLGLPIIFSIKALQDTSFYHFVSDGIQLLCERANTYPCILDAAICLDKDIGDNLIFNK